MIWELSVAGAAASGSRSVPCQSHQEKIQVGLRHVARIEVSVPPEPPGNTIEGTEDGPDRNDRIARSQGAVLLSFRDHLAHRFLDLAPRQRILAARFGAQRAMIYEGDAPAEVTAHDLCIGGEEVAELAGAADRNLFGVLDRLLQRALADENALEEQVVLVFGIVIQDGLGHAETIGKAADGGLMIAVLSKDDRDPAEDVHALRFIACGAVRSQRGGFRTARLRAFAGFGQRSDNPSKDDRAASWRKRKRELPLSQTFGGLVQSLRTGGEV